jgi:hypothetical protein
MGWRLRLLAVFLGLLGVATGAVLIAVPCFAYLGLSFWRRGPKKETLNRRRFSFGARHFLGLCSFFLAAVALAAGGTFSQIFFAALGVTFLAWPALRRSLPYNELVPVRDSIMLRSKYSPVTWFALAEIKPGAESFPRAASSFTGSMLILTGTGRAYSLVKCRSWSRRDAEAQTLAMFRSAEPAFRAGAFILPLDSVAASEVLRLRLTTSSQAIEGLPESAAMLSGLLFLDCAEGFVKKAAGFEMKAGARTPVVPASGKALEGRPLTWEVLESVGKRTRWPEPDSFSNLLESMSATKGVPIGERLKSLEGADSGLTIQGLSGGEVRTSRAQFRAIVSVYS